MLPPPGPMGMAADPRAVGSQQAQQQGSPMMPFMGQQPQAPGQYLPPAQDQVGAGLDLRVGGQVIAGMGVNAWVGVVVFR